MADELKYTPLNELCDPERGITYGIVKVGDFVVGGVPVIRGGDIRDGRIAFDDKKRVSEEVSRKFQRTILKGGELIINLIAEPGHVAIVPSELAGANVSRDVGVIPLNDTVDHRYVSYCLKSPMAVEWLTSRLQGSVTQKINLGTLRDLPIPVPSREHQRAIAHFLGTLDDRIELNRRMNETLEAMARAIFKDWFVDFGPVRAKMEGRASHLTEEVWHLFPGRLNDDGKPDGWKDSTIAQEFSLTMGQSPPGETYNESGNGLPFFQGRTDFGFRYPKRRMFCTAPTRIAEQDDTLVSVRAPVGDINMAWERCCIGRGIAAVRHRSGSRSYTYHALFSIQSELAAFEHTGTVFGSINKGQFGSLKILAPDDRLVAAFETTVGSIDERVRSNEAEAATLVQIRDLLLPKLVSGEIRIKDAEKIVGEAA